MLEEKEMAKAGGGAGRAFPGAAPKKTKDYTDAYGRLPLLG